MIFGHHCTKRACCDIGQGLLSMMFSPPSVPSGLPCWGVSVECYSMDHNEWRFASPLAQPRQNPAACALGDKVYLLGGGVATALFDNVDVYHPDTNRWFAGPALSSKVTSPCFSWRSILSHAIFLTSTSLRPSTCVGLGLISKSWVLRFEWLCRKLAD